MKKSFIILFFIILILFSSRTVLAKSNSESTPSAKINYNIAYPGILPDSLLYKLKVLRDKISERFISDPKKKIDFYLLQTDKGILSTAMLINKSEISLAKQTALKAENNYSLLTSELFNLRVKPNDSFFKNLEIASLKHQEILNSIIKRVSKKDRKDFQIVLYFSKTNLQSVKNFIREKKW